MNLELSTKESKDLKNLLKEVQIFLGRDKEDLILNAEELILFIRSNIESIESINLKLICKKSQN